MKNVFRFGMLVGASMAILPLASAGVSSAATPTNPCSNLTVDQIWSGAPVGPVAISTPNAIFAAYYNLNRILTVAKIDLSNCEVKYKLLNSQFGGYDMHNYIDMAFDKNNILHVSGNMHNNPLVYFRASKEFDINSLTKVDMTRTREEARSVTYPVFVRKETDANSDMFFMFRYGYSGNGNTFVNKYSVDKGPNVVGSWSRLNPIFTSRFKGIGLPRSETVSAYPSPPALDKDNYYHFAICWRITADIWSNFVVTYAKTKDFQSWFDAAGKELELPLSAKDPLKLPDPKELGQIVSAPGTNSGLINGARVVFSNSGKPVIVFTKYVTNTVSMTNKYVPPSASLRNGVFGATFENGRWNTKTLATSPSLVDVTNSGPTPVFGVTQMSKVIQLTYKFKDQVQQTTQNLDSETLLPTTTPPVSPRPVNIPPNLLSAVPLLAGLENDDKVTLRAAKVTNYGGPLVALRWRALPPNLDTAFKCPPSSPPYCKPPKSSLIMDTYWPSAAAAR